MAVSASALIAPPERPPMGSRNVIVKSVYAVRSLECLVRGLAPPPSVIVVVRGLADVIASWQALGWMPGDRDDELAAADPRSVEELASRLGAPPRPASDTQLGRTTWLLAVLALALDRQAARHPDWLVVRHEELCADPAAGFAAIAERVGLQWTGESAEAVAATNRPGSRYETNRVAATVSDSWRERLTAAQVDEIRSVLSAFPSFVGSALPPA
jgi:hypothetical protein